MAKRNHSTVGLDASVEEIEVCRSGAKEIET